MRFLALLGVRGQSPRGCSKPVQHKMKNFAQAKLNEEIGSYWQQYATSLTSRFSISPVLLSRARYRKRNGP